MSNQSSSGGSSGLAIRTMRSDDIGLGLELCRHARWNQLETDWRRLLGLEPDGVFVAEQDGVPCGTASTTCYGKRTAWIGMVLVHPEFRRRGIGTALLVKCIEHLRAQAIESIKLDATVEGRFVYLQLDFQDEQPIYRYAGKKPHGIAACGEVRCIEDDDWSAIAKHDFVAFDADRVELLKLLATDGVSAVIGTHEDVRGYGFARTGFSASFVGPVVATDADAARSVVETLLAQLPDGDVFWDVLPGNEACCQLADSLGFTVARRLTRMYLGTQVNPGDVNMIYGCGGFEVG